MSTDTLRDYTDKVEISRSNILHTSALTNERILVGTRIGTGTLTDYHRERLIQLELVETLARFIYHVNLSTLLSSGATSKSRAQKSCAIFSSRGIPT